MAKAKKLVGPEWQWTSPHGNRLEGPATEVCPELTSIPDRVDALLASDAVRRLVMPHVVHLVDRSSGLASVHGPFADPVAASVFADRFVAELIDVLPSGFVVTVVPLEAPEYGPTVAGAKHLPRARHFTSRTPGRRGSE